MEMDRNKIVCICMNVTYGQIEDAVNAGADNYHQVFAKVKFGAGCGGCRSRIKQMIYYMSVERDERLAKEKENG